MKINIQAREKKTDIAKVVFNISLEMLYQFLMAV
jgi:hypothetical protein